MGEVKAVVQAEVQGFGFNKVVVSGKFCRDVNSSLIYAVQKKKKKHSRALSLLVISQQQPPIWIVLGNQFRFTGP
jgi:hypothetical protein